MLMVANKFNDIIVTHTVSQPHFLTSLSGRFGFAKTIGERTSISFLDMFGTKGERNLISFLDKFGTKAIRVGLQMLDLVSL